MRAVNDATENRNEGELLSAERLAAKLSVSLATVRAWTSRCDIPHLKIGRLVRYRLNDVLIWIDRANPSLRRPV
jgi:excisionase family DNA binding protein